MKLFFENRILKRLPIDPERHNFVREVSGACFSFTPPTPVENPTLVAFSPSVLELLNIPASISRRVFDDKKDDEATALLEDMTRYLSGNGLMEGSEPASHCYCGYQFGSFAGQLGDGAAIYLGEVKMQPPTRPMADAVNHLPMGATGRDRWELQLKGAGLTPFSRTADGRKVLRSSLREFLCSEYMHAIGIPSTRAASLVTSDSRVLRDPLYTGNAVNERCSIVARVAESFIRFGSFEICKQSDGETGRSGPSANDTAPLVALFDYVAEELYTPFSKEAKEKDATAWRPVASELIFEEITKRTATLVAHWQAAGWCHGVLNTDNMSIIGLTIDYGPYAFMSHFDNDHVSNLSDHAGRYRFKQQPEVCAWNLQKLADSWSILFPDKSASYRRIIKDSYQSTFKHHYLALMRGRLGLSSSSVPDDAVVSGLLDELQFALTRSGAHYGAVFRHLAATECDSQFQRSPDDGIPQIEAMAAALAASIAKECIDVSARVDVLKQRLKFLRPSMHPAQLQQLLQLATTDPSRLRDIFRDGVDPEAILLFLREEESKHREYEQLHTELQDLYKLSDEKKAAEDVSRWVNFTRLYLNTISDYAVSDSARQQDMKKANPQFVLYPWILQDAIAHAERGSYAMVRNIVDRMERVYEPDARDGTLWSMVPPDNSHKICVSCSS